LILTNRPEIQNVIEAGIQTAARYTSQRQEAELLNFIRTILASG
jgi:hypothetical protein